MAISKLHITSTLAVLVLGLFLLTATAMADVSFDGTTFTGEGTYDEAAGTADAPLSTNLVVKGDSDSSTITLSGGFNTTGNFTHNKGVLKIAEGTVNSCNIFGIQKGGANGTTAYIYGTVNANSFTLNKTGSCTAYLNISGNLTVSGYVEFSCAKSGQGILNQTGGVVSFTTSADQNIRIAHWYTDNKYPCRYNLSGGTFNVLNATAYVGWDGPGELNISGGTANIKGIQLVGGWNNSTASGKINLTGGRLNIGSSGITLKKTNHAINLGDGTIGALASHSWASSLTVTLTSGKTPTFDIDANKTITIASTVTGSGNLKKIGAGALTLSGSNNYTGTTTITSGTLTASKIGSIGTGALTLSNATLSAPQGTIPASSVTITGDSTFISSSGWNLFKNFSGSGTLTLTGSGYLAIKDGYTASNYSGVLIVGTSSTAGNLQLESSNVLNADNGAIKVVKGRIDWGTFDQSFNSFEYLDGNMQNMTGTLTLGSEFKYNSSTDLDVPGVIAGTAQLTKGGDGTLTLSGANSYSGGTTISSGTLKLAGAGALGTGAVSVAENAELEIAYDSSEMTVNIPSLTMGENSSFKVTSGTVTFGTEDVTLNNLSGEAGNISVAGALTLNNDSQTKYVGAISADTIKKTGDGTLQIYAAAKDMVDADSFVVSSGRLDMKEYFTGALEIGELVDGAYTTATFSPGNSVGSLEITGDFTLNPGSTLLLEFDETGADSLIVSGTTEFAQGSFVTLALAEGASPLPNQQVSFQLSLDIDSFDNATLSYPSYLVGMNYDPTTGVLSATVDANAVPEPSTWALMILGVVVLFLRKRR